MKKFILLLICLLMVSCMGEMKGVFSVKGNVPHTYPAFTSEDGALYRVEGSMVKELTEKYQGTKIKIKGKLIKEKDKSSFIPGIIEVTEIVEVYK